MKKGFYLKSLLVFCLFLCSAAAYAGPLVITKNPVNRTVCVPDTTNFTVAALDTPGGSAITYSWQVSSNGGATWTTLAKDTLEYMGTATDSLIVMTDLGVNGNWYRAIAKNSDTADTTGAAILTVLHPNAGTISGGNVCKGGNHTLGSTVLGGVWMSNNNSIATINSSTGVVHGVAFGYDTIRYAVTNTCGPDTSVYVIHVDTTLTAAPLVGPNVLCKGHFITLTNANNMFGTAAWSEVTGKTTVSSLGSVTGLAEGSDVVIYTFTNACGSVTSSKTVSVDTVLNPGTISGTTTTVCYGSWIHFTASKSGGLWLSGSSDIAVVDGSGNVTGVTQGTAVISYLFSNACGVSAATTTVTVFANAAMIGGIDSVGIGHTRTLTDSTPGGMWFSADTTIAKIDTFTGLVTGVDTGVTTITYTVTNLCGTSSSYLTLTVGPPPFPGIIYGTVAKFDSSVCVGATLALFDTATDGVGVWSITNDTLATISATGVVSGLKAGLDTVLYTFTNALGTSVAMLPIYVNTPPVVTITMNDVPKVGADLFFRGHPYYDWSHTPTSIVYPIDLNVIDTGHFADSNGHVGYFTSILDSNGAHVTTNGSYIVLHGGTDNITYTVKNGCGTSKANYRIHVNESSGIVELADANTSLNVFPNPTDGAVTISLSSDKVADASVVITNVLGATIREMKIPANKAMNIRLDEPAGTYFITATTAVGKYDAKVVITK